MASATLVFRNCCSVESLKFILGSSGFVLYFSMGRYLRSRIMCCQNLLEMTSFFYISIQFPLTNLASKHFNCNKLKSIFWLCFSEVSHASLPISLPTGKTGSYPRHPMVPQPSNPNYHQILSLLLPKYISDQSVSVYLATSQYLLQPPSYLCSTQ